MLLWRAKEILEGGGELLKAEAELASVRLRRALVGSFIVLCFMLLGFIGLLIVLGGGAILLAAQIGWGRSLLTIGLGLVFAAGLTWIVHWRSRSIDESVPSLDRHGQIDQPPKVDAQEAKERMSDAMHEEPETSANKNPLGGMDGLKDDAIEYAMRNPTLVGGAALLAISLIGPGRSLRMLSRGVAAAGLVRTAIDAIAEDDDGSADAASKPATGGKPQNKSPQNRNTQGRQPASSNGVRS